MKVDNIQKIDSSESVHSGGSLEWKSYYTLFFVALIFVFTMNAVNIAYKLLNIKQDVTYAVEKGYNEFLANLNEKDGFYQAKQHFLNAKMEVGAIIQADLFMKEGTIINSVDDLLQISINLTESAELTFEVEKMLNGYFKDIHGKKDLSEVEAKLDQAIAQVDESVALFQGVNMDFFKTQMSTLEYEKLTQLRDQVYSLQGILAEIKSNIHPLFIFLGDRYPNRILILLQNNNEIRPTGGFIGSLGFVDLNDGRIENISVRDVYDFDGQAFERAPNSEMSMVSGQDWGIRDSNTSPDFEISARQAKRFLEEAKGPGVDSVVAVDLEFVRAILKRVGPIEIEEFALTFTDENFDIILSYLVESKQFGRTTPKEILKYFLADIETAIYGKIEPLEFMAILADAVSEKHVQAYSDDEEVQNWFKDLGAAGNLSPAAPYNDYLNVINVSVGGNKTDMFMWQALKHETFIKKDGELLNQLTIKRTHTWNEDAENWVHDQLRTAAIYTPHPEMMRILGRDTNKVMVRAYVPYGSKLTTAMGVDMEDVKIMTDEVITYDGFGKTTKKLTYFLFPMETEISQTNEVILAYELPFKLNFDPLDDYRLFFDKQAGVKSVDFEKYIYYGGRTKSFASNPEFIEVDNGELYRAVLHTDRVMSVAVGEE